MKGTSAQTLLEKIEGLQKTETQIILNYVNYLASWKEIETVYSWIKDLDEENRALFLIDLVKTVQKVYNTPQKLDSIIRWITVRKMNL